MGKWTDRQCRLVQAWLHEQWNVPNRTDYYLMRVAQRVHSQWNKKPVSLKDQIIDFNLSASAEETREAKIARSKAIWMGGVRAAEAHQKERCHGI